MPEITVTIEITDAELRALDERLEDLNAKRAGDASRISRQAFIAGNVAAGLSVLLAPSTTAEKAVEKKAKPKN